MAFTASRHRRPALVLGLVLAGLAAGPATAAHAAVTDPGPFRVTICHTGGGDGLVEITPSASGVLNGHEGHDGDVIPPFTVDGVAFEGRNWDAAGQATYANLCVTPTSTGDDPSDDPGDGGEVPGDPSDPGDDPSDPGDVVDPAPGQSPTSTPTTAVLADDNATDPEDAPAVTAVLAETGSDVTSLAALAIGIIAAGAAAVVATHRRARRATR